MLQRSLVLLHRRLSFYYRGVQFVPLPQKAQTGGQDAYLSTGGVQSVLDGVSWWRNNAQVDAGLYSAAIARSMYQYVEQDLLGDIPASSYRLLQQAYNSCKHGNVVGTCTALVATLQQRNEQLQAKDGYKVVDLVDGEQITDVCVDQQSNKNNLDKQKIVSSQLNLITDVNKQSQGSVPHLSNSSQILKACSSDKNKNNYLDVALIGDCSVMIIRQGRIVFVSQQQSHDLDYPYQIGSGSKDTPSDCVRLLIPVQRGDIIVMGTDGLFDNLYTQRIAQIIWPSMEKAFVQNNFFDITPETYSGVTSATKFISKSWKKMQQNLTKGNSPNFAHRRFQLTDVIMNVIQKSMQQIIDEAVTISRDVHGDSPYASKCIENGALYQGGKPDDITLLVSVLDDVDESSQGDRFAQSEIRYPIPYRDWP